MGAWLDRNGEAIYGTRGGPFKPGDWGASTRRGTRIYIHAFAWNGDTLRLPALPVRVVSARRLAGGPVEMAQDAFGVTLRLPQAQQDPVDTVIVLEAVRPVMGLAPIPAPSVTDAKPTPKTRR